MGNFEYRVTLIIPVYNVEKYIDNCLYSVVAQTIDKSDIEVLLINDGSTDNSLEICYDFERNFDFFKVFTKENEGLSATRNFGIRQAKGKYLMYLDSDDTLTSETIENIANFFDDHYDEIDLVTYPIVPYKDNIAMRIHFRYKILTKTDVYDLNENPFIIQTTINTVTKNIFEHNILFDETPHFRQEDQKYNNYVLMDKMKIGFCKEAEYRYLRNADSITMTIFNPIEIFETSMKFFEDMFAIFNDDIPKYIQAMYFHDISWKLKENILFPYHYDKDEFDIAVVRLINLLNCVDNDIIMNYPNSDNYVNLYWVRQKQCSNLIPYIKKNNMIIYDHGEILYQRKNIEIILKRILVKQNNIKIVGYFKSPFFSLLDNCEFLVLKNDNITKIKTKLASSSYYRSKEQTETFWAFSYETNITTQTEIKFLVEIDGIIFKTVFWNTETTPFNKNKLTKYPVENLVIEQLKNSFNIKIIDKINFKLERNIIDEIYKENNEIYDLRKLSNVENFPKRIWLYYDNFSVYLDNGYFQFIHDIEKNDEIDRYYIITNNEQRKNLAKRNIKNVVEFGSFKHKLLFLNCEKILTSFIEHNSIFPFDLEDRIVLNDIFNAEFIYLQHGILHAHLPWYYTPIGVQVDKVIISSEFENKNFQENYSFNKNDLIPTGMARYDHIEKKAPTNNKILFAPSWRSYLIGDIENNNIIRTGHDNKILNSNYYINIMKFVNNSKLFELLEKFDLTLELKLHPQFFTTYKHLININCERIKLADNSVDLSEYKVFITDFSSFVFDYAYFNRPILYFVPDYIEFKAGLNRYRKLDLPFEDAFGELTTTAEDAVNALEKIINNNFIPEKIYSNRMDNFYLPLENCCEKLYDYLMNDL